MANSELPNPGPNSSEQAEHNRSIEELQARIHQLETQLMELVTNVDPTDEEFQTLLDLSQTRPPHEEWLTQLQAIHASMLSRLEDNKTNDART